MPSNPSVGLPACLRACTRGTEQQRKEQWVYGCLDSVVRGIRHRECLSTNTPACPHAWAPNHLPSPLPACPHPYTRAKRSLKTGDKATPRPSHTASLSTHPPTLTIFSSSFLRATNFSCLTSRYTHQASHASASTDRRLSPLVLIARLRGCAASGAAQGLSEEAALAETRLRQFSLSRTPPLGAPLRESRRPTGAAAALQTHSQATGRLF